MMPGTAGSDPRAVLKGIGFMALAMLLLPPRNGIAKHLALSMLPSV